MDQSIDFARRHPFSELGPEHVAGLRIRFFGVSRIRPYNSAFAAHRANEQSFSGRRITEIGRAKNPPLDSLGNFII
jgi:hypothetical protein